MKNLTPQKLLRLLQEKAIAVLGFGVEGKSAVNYLLRQGIKNITVCDQKNAAELPLFEELKKLPVKRQLGVGWERGIAEGQFDLVIRSPGVPPTLPFLKKISSKKSKTKLVSTTKFFFDLTPAPILGITGTKGKGTTASLAYQIIKQNREKGKVYLGGNIGVAPFDFLEKLTGNDLVVLELSSFQLVDLDSSPHWAVVLNVTSDHLDWHRSQEEYLAAKYNIVKHQYRDDFAIVNADYLTSIEFATQTNGQVWWFSARKSVDRGMWWQKDEKEEKLYFRPFPRSKPLPVLTESEVKLLGRHNLENVAAAALASYLVGVKLSQIAPVVRRFRGLPHRLQKIATIEGIEFVEDSFSTNPQTAIAAIRSFDQPKILILGGYDKNISFRELAENIVSTNVRAVVLIGQTARKIAAAIKAAGKRKKLPQIKFARSLDEAVRQAYQIANAGEVVLFSPACASFDMFTDYKERGEKFIECVKKLQLA